MPEPVNNLEWLDEILIPEDNCLKIPGEHCGSCLSDYEDSSTSDMMCCDHANWRDKAKQAIAAKINEMLIGEVSNILPLLDAEFAYYAGGKPYSNATGTTDKNSRIKKVIENRIAELRKRKQYV